MFSEFNGGSTAVGFRQLASAHDKSSDRVSKACCETGIGRVSPPTISYKSLLAKERLEHSRKLARASFGSRLGRRAWWHLIGAGDKRSDKIRPNRIVFI